MFSLVRVSYHFENNFSRPIPVEPWWNCVRGTAPHSISFSLDCWFFIIKILFFKIHRTNSTFRMKTMRTPLKGANVLFYLKSKQCFVCALFFSLFSISLSVARRASRSLFGGQTIITIKYKSEKNVWCFFPKQNADHLHVQQLRRWVHTLSYLLALTFFSLSLFFCSWFVFLFHNFSSHFQMNREQNKT